jgi:hypothetical protein
MVYFSLHLWNICSSRDLININVMLFVENITSVVLCLAYVVDSLYGPLEIVQNVHTGM